MSESEFKMYFRLIVCGKVVNNTLKSPGYPNDYPKDTDCIYVVPIPRDMNMKVTFQKFDIEDGFYSCE